MVQLFDDAGKVTPGTVISAMPLTVTQIKSKEIDGYNAVQVGYGSQKEQRINKSQKGHYKDLAMFRGVKEFIVPNIGDFSRGQNIGIDSFASGDKIHVSGISKGKGFQGVVKRHGFKGGPRTHGQKHSEREPGSIGGGLRTHVPKGMRMAGRTGSDKITVRNLKVLAIDAEANQMIIKGALPGRRGTMIEIISK